MRIDAVQAAAQMLELNAGKTLENVNPGDVLRVQVAGKSDGEVVLRLSDGRKISASSLVPLDVPVGQFVELMVKDKQGGKIFLETLKNSTQTNAAGQIDSRVKTLLDSIMISHDPKNISIVKEMLECEVPVTKQNVLTVLNNISKYQNLDVPKAVFMMANGVAFEEKSIDFLNQYAQSKIALGSQIESLLNQLDNLSDNEITAIYNKLVDLQQQKNISKASAEAAASVQGDSVENPKSNIPLKEIALSSVLKEVLPAIKETIINNIENQVKTGQININSDIKQPINSDFKQLIMNMSTEELEAFVQKLPDSARTEIESILKMKFPAAKELNVQEIKASPENTEHIKNSIRGFFEKHFIKNTSDTLPEDLHVAESYKDILVKLDAVRSVLSSGDGRTDIMNLVGQTADNIKFMNNLSQYNSFIQIPLNIWGQNTNGELYILKKSKKRIDPGNASLFLSLDMPNMGLTEVLVSVNRKTLNCGFRVQDEKLVLLVRENSANLVSTLKKLGYSIISVECSVIQEKTGLIDVNKIVAENESPKKLAIDVKV